MNSQYTISVKVDSTGAIGNLNEVEEVVKKSNSNLIEMRAELKAIQSEMLGLAPGTAEFNKLAAEAGKVKDQMNDVAEQINANAAPAIESVGNQFGLLQSKLMNLDFAGAGEAMTALGASMKRVSAKDITDGIKSITTGFVNMGKALLTNPIFLVVAAIGAAVAYREELLSMVDGVSNAELDALNIAKEKAAVEQENLNAISEQENILKLQGKSEEEILKLKIAQTDEAIAAAEVALEGQKQIRDQQIDAAKRNQEILAGFIKFVNAPITLMLTVVEKIAWGLKEIGAITEESFKKVEGLADKSATWAASFVFNPEETAQKADADIKEAEKGLTKLKNQRAGFILQQQKGEKKASDDSKKRNEERLKQEQEINQRIAESRNELLMEIEKLENDAYEATLSQQEQDLRKVDEYYFDLIERAKQAGIETTSLEQLHADARTKIIEKENADKIKAMEDANAKLKEIAEQRAQDEEELDERIYQAKTDKRILEKQEVQYKYAQDLADAEKQGKDFQALQQKLDTELKDLKKKWDEEDLAAQMEKMTKTVEIVSSSLSIISDINEFFGSKGEEQTKRQFEISKAVNIAQALVNTFTAVTGQLAVPQDQLKGINFIKAGAALTMGLLNVSKIAKTKYKGGSSSGGGGGGSAGSPSGSVGGSPTPAFNPMDTAFLNNRPGQQQAPPIKTYVLQNEVATSQEAAEKISALTTIG